VAGGIATALPLLPRGPALIVSGDIFTSFDYASVRQRATAMAREESTARAHLVLVPNPRYHPGGDFALADGLVALERSPRYTYASIGLYDSDLFRELPRGAKLKLLPYLQRWIADGQVSGETFNGAWANVGTPDDLAELDARCGIPQAPRKITSFSNEPLPLCRRDPDTSNHEYRAQSTSRLRWPAAFRRHPPRHVDAAVDQLLAAARRSGVRRHRHPPATWDIVAEPLAGPLDQLDRAWGAARHLNAVVSTPEWRSAYHANLPKVTAFFSDLAQDVRLFARYRELAAASAFATLDPAKRRAVTNELRDFRLGGAELPAPEKARLKAVHEELAVLSARFDDNLLDATNEWAFYVTDPDELSGVPDSVKAEARAAAAAEGKPGFKLTLRMPCYLPVMSHADNRALRATMHRAFATRASDLGNPRVGQRPPIRASCCCGASAHFWVSEFRRPLARAKMAKASTTCSSSCATSRAAPGLCQRDYAEPGVRATELGIADLQPWDRAYASRSSSRGNSRSRSSRCAAIFRKGKYWKGSSAWRRRSTGFRSARAKPRRGTRTSGSSTSWTPRAR
jgi:hypothetical protein